MTKPTVRVRKDDGVARVVIDRPPLNVLDIPTMELLAEELQKLGAAPDVRVLVLTGEGKAFCAGVDVADHTAERVERMLEAFHRVVVAILEMSCPVVAAVNGHALGGGCELVAAADLAFARVGAKLGQPEVRLGVFPPAAAALLPRKIGRHAAMDLVLSGRTIDADEAARLRLVARAIPAERFEAEVDAYVRGVADLSAPVLKLAKRAVSMGAELPVPAALEVMDDLYANELMALDDAQEGLAAFMEKREPVWKGS